MKSIRLYQNMRLICLPRELNVDELLSLRFYYYVRLINTNVSLRTEGVTHNGTFPSPDIRIKIFCWSINMKEIFLNSEFGSSIMNNILERGKIIIWVSDRTDVEMNENKIKIRCGSHQNMKYKLNLVVEWFNCGLTCLA